MAKGREKSDGRVLPQGGRKAVLTDGECRGGKATTVSNEVGQLELFSETADSPRGADGGADRGRPRSATRAVPKSEDGTGSALPAMTMTEVANEENLRRAFDQVASNNGASGPDKQSVEEVRERLDAILRVLNRELLEGAYQPGFIRRVWIPKAGGGQRGLGIPTLYA